MHVTTTVVQRVSLLWLCVYVCMHVCVPNRSPRKVERNSSWLLATVELP